MSRLPTIEPEKLSGEQRRVYDAISGGSRGGVRGALLALLHVPELANRVQHLGEYFYETSFPPRLAQLAILITARHYTCQYQWVMHEPRALKGGLAQSIVDAIKEKRHPEGMRPDETVVFEFTTELLRNGKLSDAIYERTVTMFGTTGVVELPALIGSYIMAAMTLLSHDVQPTNGEQPLRA